MCDEAHVSIYQLVSRGGLRDRPSNLAPRAVGDAREVALLFTSVGDGAGLCGTGMVPNKVKACCGGFGAVCIGGAGLYIGPENDVEDVGGAGSGFIGGVGHEA